MNIDFGTAEPQWIDPMITMLAVLFGSILAWVTSYYFELKKLKNEELSIAYSLIFKVQHFANELVQLERQVKEGIERAESEGAGTPVWTKMVDVVGFKGDPESINSKELALIAKTQDLDLLMKIRELESGHHIMVSVMSKISEFRIRLADTDLAEAVSGRTVSFAASPDQYPKVAPLLISLNDLSAGLATDLPRITKSARELANRLGPTLKKYYKFKHFVVLSFVDSSPI